MKRQWWRGICVMVVILAAGLAISCSSSQRDPAASTAQSSPSPLAAALSPEMVARADIQARYEAMAQALKAKNVKKYMENFTPDYKFTNENGETDSRATVESQMGDALEYTDTLTYSARIDDFRLEGELAHLTVSETMTSTKTDKAGKHVIEALHVLESQWTKRPSGWKLARAREKSVTMTMDGKPLGGPEPAPSPPAAKSPRAAGPRS